MADFLDKWEQWLRRLEEARNDTSDERVQDEAASGVETAHEPHPPRRKGEDQSRS